MPRRFDGCKQLSTNVSSLAPVEPRAKMGHDRDIAQWLR
jgi:hypothetical protein